MIFDSIENIDRYTGGNELLEKAAKLIKQITDREFAPGRIESGDGRVYANLCEFTTESLASAIGEAHTKFIDIFTLFEGEELILTQDMTDAPKSGEYNAENDYQLYSTAKNANSHLLKKGKFLLVFPGEVHTVLVSPGDRPQSVKQAVIKVKIY